MLVRNYAKPFCIAGFILAEIYMLFIVFAPYSHEKGRSLPVPVPMEDSAAPGTPPPLSNRILTALTLSIFCGPFGALAGLGIGLAYSATLQAFRERRDPPKASFPSPPEG